MRFFGNICFSQVIFFKSRILLAFGLVGPSPGNCGSAQLDLPEIKGHPEQLLFDASYSQV